jgi:predicted protein tyrosine phosphatase
MILAMRRRKSRSVHLLSIWDSDVTPPEYVCQHPDVRIARFDDVTRPYPSYGWVPATLRDVERLVVPPEAPREHTLVHCTAGISRSSAILLALLAQDYQMDTHGTLLARFDDVVARSNKLGLRDPSDSPAPNPHVVTLAAQALGRGGGGGLLLLDAYQRRWPDLRARYHARAWATHGERQHLDPTYEGYVRP